MTDATALQSPSILLMGPPGTGKTWSLATLLKAGLEVFVIVTEPNGVDTLLDAVHKLGLPVDKLHYHYIAPVAAGWGAMTDMVRSITNNGYEDLTKMKAGIGKQETSKPMFELLTSMANFPDDRTGQKFGDVTSWDASRALAIDSTTGLNLMMMANTIGYKPAAHQGEWGVAMNLQQQFILKLCADCKCYLVITAHVDRETNEVTGRMLTTASMLGRKNAGKILPLFSEVVLAEKKGGVFSWSTTGVDVDVKNRALPLAEGQAPDFTPIIEVFRRRLAQTTPTAPAAVA